jgi:glycogen synthase
VIYEKMKRLNPDINYKIISQGVDNDEYNITLKNPKYILYLSRLDIHQKGIDLLIYAYKKIFKRIPFKLVIAGHGPDELKIRKLVKSQNLEDHVIMYGSAYGKEKLELMSKSLFVAFPSRHDEQPLWILEALAAGLPLVTFDLPESKWLGNKVRLNSTPFDVDEYAARLLYATNADVNSKMRKEAKLFARRFSWDRVTNETENYFYQVLEMEKDRLSVIKSKPYISFIDKFLFKEIV